MSTPAGDVSRIRTTLSRADLWGAFRSRVGAYRMTYTVPPGLYAVGSPGAESEVLVSANYKLSFDHLRRSLGGMNAWVLVLDTKGINVWCAAGKGTFGTDEIVRLVREAGLEKLVSHRRLIIPQLGAPGVAAHEVMRATGFRVHYGPVRAADIPEYLRAGLKATPAMRTVSFPMLDRLVLTPMEIRPALKWYPLFALIVLLIFGLRPQGIIFKDALLGGWPFLALGIAAIFSGAFFAPVLLPLIPFRSFALKGWLTGIATTAICLAALPAPVASALAASAYVFFPAASSYIALQFTGSTTFTGMSGVQRELRLGLPLYLAAAVLSVGLLAAHKIASWGTI